MRRAGLILYCFVFFVLILLPYIFAAAADGDSYQFGGFLLNPIDGNTYLAKMQIGSQGDWKFQLPYTAETGNGGYLFLFYILLGKVASLLGLPFLVVFHLARAVSAAVLLIVLIKFINQALKPYNPGVKTSALVLVSFGSGLGWAAALFGGFTSDFWVAEAYPFLSAYANPHFPLGMALLLDFFLQLSDFGNYEKIKYPWLAVKGLLLSIVMPFGIVVAGVVASGFSAWVWMRERKILWKTSAAFLTAGTIYLLYQFIAIRMDPLLRAWDSQNLTPSPPFWDFILSFSPVLLAAIFFLYKNRESINQPLLRICIIWLFSGVVLAYLPFNLQRRFLFAYFIPVAALGTMGLWLLSGFRPSRYRKIFTIIFLLSVLTNLFILVGGVNAINHHDPSIYISRSEITAFEWMAEQQGEPVVLANERSGLYIPAYTGWRVVYGHPFETVDAEIRLKEVKRFFQAEISPAEVDTVLEEEGIDFIYFGPSDSRDIMSIISNRVDLVYQNQDVDIYAIRRIP